MIFDVIRKNLKDKIYYETKNGILLNGDCLEIIDFIPQNSIDLILTDPPYGINYTNWDKLPPFKILFNDFNFILKKNGQLFLFSGWSNICFIIQQGLLYFHLKDWIIWDRIKGRGCKKSLVSTREDILWFVKNLNNYIFNKEYAYSTIKKKTKGYGLKNKKDTRALSNVWTDISPLVAWSKEYTKHPTQKPLQLFKRIIKVFSNENDIVLDPFMGSGTTAVVCEQLNRKWIGIEIEEKYCKICKERLQEVQNEFKTK